MDLLTWLHKHELVDALFAVVRADCGQDIAPLVRKDLKLMVLRTCSQPEIFETAGIAPGRCIDPDWIAGHIGRPLPVAKDPHQRPRCGCAASRDIGAYDTCLFGCAYCYATTSFDRARRAFAGHDPDAPSLG